jgi:hypothetical protein
MARDAIARQYDVDKNLVTLTSEPGKGGYRPGLITFFPKKGKTLDLDKIHESITATRLSGGTRMGVDYLEITARGAVVVRDRELLLKVSGADQPFVLAEEPGTKAALSRLREALTAGATVTSITGRVQGWSGTFPNVLKALADAKHDSKATVLLVTDFAVSR